MSTTAPRACPAGSGISLLRVYDREAPDGLVGGSPHVHLACAGGYCVVAGIGAVQTLNATGYDETALKPGTVVWFDPGASHRHSTRHSRERRPGVPARGAVAQHPRTHRDRSARHVWPAGDVRDRSRLK